MQSNGALDIFPLWAVFLAIPFLILLSVEGGYRLGKLRQNRGGHEMEAPVGAMAGATLGLLAFMLAFTFGLASERFDARRRLVLDEANAIRTTYLRARMLPDRREEIRALLRDYVDARLEAVRSGDLVEGKRRSEKIQDQLWAHAVAVAEKNPTSIVVGLFVQSLNEVLEIQTKRITVGLRSRIPGAVWAALFAITVLSLAAMGYHAGLVGTSRSPAIFAVALAFSAAIGLIADLDRPQEGNVRVSQQVLIDARQSMNVPGP